MFFIKAITIISSAACVSGSIVGINYMDPLNSKPLKSANPEQDACNPLYWYPKNIPEYCYYKTPKPEQKPVSFPLPVPIPVPPQPMPYPALPTYAAPSPYPMSPSFLIPVPPTLLSPMPFYQQPIPLPYGIPIEPTNPMLPVAGVPGLPYPSIIPHYRPQYQAGLVPGIPGIVTHDGGINILPFSDAYADLLEKHKHKMIRKKIKKILNEYDDFPERNGENKPGHKH